MIPLALFFLALIAWIIYISQPDDAGCWKWRK